MKLRFLLSQAKPAHPEESSKVSKKCYFFSKFLTFEMHCTQWGNYILSDTSYMSNQRQIQDFPGGGGANSPQRGHQHAILPNFPENRMKSKEFGCPGSTPKSATGNDLLVVYI